MQSKALLRMYNGLYNIADGVGVAPVTGLCDIWNVILLFLTRSKTTTQFSYL